MADDKQTFIVQDKFMLALFGEDELGVVIRAHIHIESRLYELLGLISRNEEYLRKLNLEFSQYVDLAVALGLDPDHAKGLRALGKLRNEFAHKLDSNLTDSRVRSLYESFSSTDKEIIQAAYVRTKAQFGDAGPGFKDLSPKDRFILIAVAVHQMLGAALLETHRMMDIQVDGGEVL